MGTRFYPIHRKRSSPSGDLVYEFKCIDQGRELYDEYFYVTRGFDYTTNTQLNLTDLIPDGVIFKRLVGPTVLSNAGYTSPFDKRSEICLKMDWDPISPDCIERRHFGYKCSRCRESKVLTLVHKGPNTCGTGCDMVDIETGICLQCGGDKLPNATNTDCTGTNIQTNCNYKSPWTNTCLICNAGHFVNSAKVCTPPNPNCVSSAEVCTPYTHRPNCRTR